MSAPRSKMCRKPVVLCVIAIAGSVSTANAGTRSLVANEDVVICSRFVDMEDYRKRADAKDDDGMALYLKGPQPPCLAVSKGERVDELDHAGNEVQVVTNRGVPRFIGWGDRNAFGEVP